MTTIENKVECSCIGKKAKERLILSLNRQVVECNETIKLGKQKIVSKFRVDSAKRERKYAKELITQIKRAPKCS